MRAVSRPGGQRETQSGSEERGLSVRFGPRLPGDRRGGIYSVLQKERTLPSFIVH